MTTRNFVWWGIYTAIGIWLQSLIPGVDFLVPGLLYAMQERNIPQLAWIVPAFILIQEGLGTLDFGAVVLWYLTVLFLFLIGHWIFQSENWLFVILVSCLTAAAHYLILSMMCSLQSLVFDSHMLLRDSAVQAVLTPVAWKLAALTRKWVLVYEDSAQS